MVKGQLSGGEFFLGAIIQGTIIWGAIFLGGNCGRTINAFFLSFKTSVHPFCFIFSLWFFCKSYLALQELSNDVQHGHI